MDVYHSEQSGEVTFEALLQAAEDAEQRFILGSFLQMETEGKALIRPALMKLGLPIVDDPDARSKGVVGVSELNDLPWTDRFGLMAKVTEARYLPKYEELASLIAEEDDPEAYRLAKFMGDHERAIIEAFENIAAGRPDPIAPVVSLLTFPLAPPQA
ncbi:MAG: hypothetical protein AAFX03_12010 [Pseudomonadota bacterium]